MAFNRGVWAKRKHLVGFMGIFEGPSLEREGQGSCSGALSPFPMAVSPQGEAGEPGMCVWTWAVMRSWGTCRIPANDCSTLLNNCQEVSHPSLRADAVLPQKPPDGCNDVHPVLLL